MNKIGGIVIQLVSQDLATQISNNESQNPSFTLGIKLYINVMKYLRQLIQKKKGFPSLQL